MVSFRQAFFPELEDQSADADPCEWWGLPASLLCYAAPWP